MSKQVRTPVILLAAFLIGLPCATCVAADLNLLVELKAGPSLTADAPPKLSRALRATLDSDGVFKGTNDIGEPVISVPAAAIERLTANIAVANVRQVGPQVWTPAKQLKVSYTRDHRPTADELKAMGLRRIEDYERGQFLVVEPVSGQINAAVIRSLLANENVRYAAASINVKAIPPSNSASPPATQPVTAAVSPNDPMLADLWGMKNIHADLAWPVVHDTEQVVAVLDTGVDYRHEDLAANMWTQNNQHGYDFVDNDNDPMDANGHGTHCAGTIGAVGNNSRGVVGVNWKVKIMAVRWLDAQGNGNVVNAIKAIDWAVDNGAKILSNSWYWIEDDPDLQAAIDRANAANVLFVAAAGNFRQQSGNNDGNNDLPSTYGRIPSAYAQPNILAVAAIDASNALAAFSQWGRTSVDMAAPGVLIKSTVPHDGYDGSYSGTSMATPHVAGAAALYLARHSSASAADVKKALLDNARPLPQLSGKCVTGGTLDLAFLAR